MLSPATYAVARMVAIALTAVVTCLGALIVGQAVLRACGFERWSWLAAPVGLGVEILVAVPALHVPGRATTTAVLLGILILASAVWILRDPTMRPPLGDLLAAGPVAALAFVPFAAAGRAGTLGVGFNNDMASHLLYAQSYGSAAIAHVTPLPADYPLGPHALVATLSQGLGVDVDPVFAGVTAATAILLAWLAIGLLGERVRWPGRMLVATVAGMPFLVAGYYGQGSFKELMQALFVLGLAAALSQRAAARASRLRLVPLALIVAGSLSVYGFLGLPWFAATLGAALLAAGVRRTWDASLRAALADARAGLVPTAIAVGVLAFVMVAQIPRLEHFLSKALSVNGTGIATSDIGNLVGPLPVWEASGIWESADYRLPALDQFAAGMWTALVVALVAFGTAWCLRRGEWALPLTAFVAFVIWAVSDRSQSPYVAAKGLLVLSPLVLVLAIRPLVERDERLPRWWRVVAPVLALVLTGKVVQSSWHALRFGSVGPTEHLSELRSLRPLLHGERTLFLGNDDFIPWELAGVPVEAPVIGFPRLPFKAGKQWAYGDALDIDSVEPDAINARDWVITTRDALGSSMPPQLRLVKQTRSYALWRRTATVQPRAVLDEGTAGGAILDCTTTKGRAIVRRGGTAFVRPLWTGVAVPDIAAGTSVAVDLRLRAGTYDLSMPYVSSQPIDVEVVSRLKTRMPANLDRPGPRWPIGRITVRAGDAPLRIGLYAQKRRLTSPLVVARVPTVFATPVGGTRTVSIRAACGKLVDWYKPATRP